MAISRYKVYCHNCVLSISVTIHSATKTDLRHWQRSVGISGDKTFKNGNPAFLYGGVVLFLGLQGPADAFGLPDFPAQIVADGGLAVTVLIGHKVRYTQEIGQVVGQGELQHGL